MKALGIFFLVITTPLYVAAYFEVFMNHDYLMALIYGFTFFFGWLLASHLIEEAQKDGA